MWCSRRCGRRRPSRRPSIASAPRSSSGCCRPARACRPSASCASGFGIARSTLRQALVALGQSGHVHALRGRGGGTFVADPLPPALPPSSELLAQWRDVCDERRAIEVGIAQLAAERAPQARRRSARPVRARDGLEPARLPQLPPSGRAPARRDRRADRQPPAGGADDRDSGLDEQPDLADRPSARGARRSPTISIDGWSSVCAVTTQAGPDARWPNTPGAPSTCWPGCCPTPDLRTNLSNRPLIGAAEPVTI